ncbi:hypothetical protein IDM40_25455 [Nocardiopsis sp. HNM0947]|uniref:Glycosyl transferase family 2 n=1 Tax=Nocardiopsis coralli TaxID=2772213 RepID=A0ABR9PDW5_9ACTN|nr:hypothetical protein [Nocardiopsis coralli]MBE3002018.1 hypothetical protein [Nocardiopsis coralli]
MTATREAPDGGGIAPLGDRPGVTVVVPVHCGPGSCDTDPLAQIVDRARERIVPGEDVGILVCTTASPEVCAQACPEAFAERPDPHGVRILAMPGPVHRWELVRAGLAAAAGDVVLLARADALPEREEVDGHVRAHLAEHAAVVVGGVTAAAATGGPRPDHLRDRYPDGTVSHRRDLLTGVGVGDTRAPEELLHRLLQFGAALVPGPGSEAVEKSGGGRRDDAGGRDADLEHRVPWHPARRARPGRLWEVPFVDVVVDASRASADEVRLTTDLLLGGADRDLRLTLVGPWGARDRATADTVRLLREVYRYEPRVHMADHVPAPVPGAPFRLTLPAGAEPAHDAIRSLTKTADEHAAGRLVLPCGDRGSLRWERTAALARARLTGGGEDGIASPWTSCTVDAGVALEQGPPWPADGPDRTRTARREAKNLREDALRWERRIRALTRGRAARLVLGRRPD